MKHLSAVNNLRGKLRGRASRRERFFAKRKIQSGKFSQQQIAWPAGYAWAAI
jgi:hypothetical protein